MENHQGELIKRELKSRKMTQEELAQKLGIERPTLVNRLKAYKLKPAFIEAITETLGLPKGYFNVEEEDYKAKYSQLLDECKRLKEENQNLQELLSDYKIALRLAAGKNSG